MTCLSFRQGIYALRRAVAANLLFEQRGIFRHVTAGDRPALVERGIGQDLISVFGCIAQSDAYILLHDKSQIDSLLVVAAVATD